MPLSRQEISEEPTTDFDRWEWELAKLRRSAARLEAGEILQPSVLKPALRLIPEHEAALGFAHFLVRRTWEFYRSGRSLMLHSPVDEVTKSEWLATAAVEFASIGFREMQWTGVSAKLTDIYSRIRQVTPGSLRIWINASRRRLGDSDLLVVEFAYPTTSDIRNLREYVYLIAVQFCCEYRWLRWTLTPRSFQRFQEIIRYLETRHPDSGKMMSMSRTDIPVSCSQK